MHPCSKPPRTGWRFKRPQGAAIIVALLAVALVAGLATTILFRLDIGIERDAGLRDQAQARQLALSTVDYARLTLEADARTTRIDWTGEAWAQPLSPALNPEARIRLSIADASGMSEHNALIRAIAEPRHLNSGTSVLIEGDGKPSPSLAVRINVNTAPPETLRLVLPGATAAQAATVASQLRQQPIETLKVLAERLPEGINLPDPEQVDVISDLFLADVIVEYGVSTFALQALLARSDGGVRVVTLKLR